MNKFGLTDKQLNLIKNILSKHPNIEKVILFGSRAKGNFKKYSDIDIALLGSVTSLNAEKIKLDLNELPIIYKFDVLSYNELKNPQLKQHIDRVGVPLL